MRIQKPTNWKLGLGVLGILGAIFLIPGSAFASSRTLPVELPDPPPLNWQPCDDVPDRDCATLTVPLDYADLSKGTIGIPVSRAVANDAVNRVGSLVYNPGGPGRSVAGTVRYNNDQELTRFFSSELIAKFDIIGFDPRGTTDNFVCLETSAEKNAYWEANHLPKTTTEIQTILNLERQANEGCLSNNEPLARHVDTASVVRDMELLRRAMGVDKFNYMGQSYGGFLGNRYAALYPGHLRTMVIDSTADHSAPDLQTFSESNLAFDAAWKDFKKWCQDGTTATCRLHGQDVDAVFNQVLAQARTNPISAPQAGRPVNDWILTTMVQALTAPGSVTFNWVDRIIWDAQRGNASLARALYDQGTGYLGNDQYYIGGDQHRAIVCLDTRWSQLLRTPQEVKVLAQVSKTIAPRFGEANVYQGPAQCHGYPVEPVEAPPVASKVPAGQPPVLVVGATKDASTPLLWSIRASANISGSRLLVRQGEGHVSYDKSRCIQQKVDRYLIDLQLPPQGALCNTDSDLYPPLDPPPELPVNVRSILDGSSVKAALPFVRAHLEASTR